ncbi:MAG: AEC family transporter [Moorea sp. SIO1F2]|uniref:AEC family transporter n=1 Tax=unclassified Moorena TaxID=2683338 RepID=UPI0013BA919D|nr:MULTISPECIES: AEC family transporter [unclassified Moorena]NEO47576.1 AEC family transporter [Moorena sp. SIO4A3]NEO16126.1 AEC family transporter [Moorena sp. SIO3E8]NEP20575.1 AEC family transporter [Moorena sp. SIO3I6]NEQ02631.1 AEC family transporter [Moorena sp. SIO3F7]NET82713.1 AEC family transporter [Moorena sp. SIO1F2]
MTVLLPAVVSVGLIILIGFIAGRTLSLDKQTLSQVSLYILVPALIADSLYRTTLSTESTIGLVAGLIITAVLLYLLSWGLGKLLKLPPVVQKSFMVAAIFPNAGNLGLPLNSFAFGTPGLERAIVYMITAALLMFAICPALLKGGSISSGVRLTLKLPLLWAMLAGLTWRLLRLKLPLGLDQGIHQLGMAAIPIDLIVLGIQLSRTRLVIGRYEVLATTLRLLVAPLIAHTVGQALGLEGLNLQVLVLQSAMPVAISTVVLVTEFGGDAPLVARTVVLSTLVSFLSLPLVLWATT